MNNPCITFILISLGAFFVYEWFFDLNLKECYRIKREQRKVFIKYEKGEKK